MAGGDWLAVVTAMAVMRWDGGVPEVDLQVAGTPGCRWPERQERNYYEHLRRKFGDTP